MAALFDLVKQIIERQYPNLGEMTTGTIVSTTPTTALVRMNGTSSTQECPLPMGFSISRGNACVLVRPKRSPAWSIVGAFSATPPSADAKQTEPSQLELAPPLNMRARPLHYSLIAVEWDTPPQQIVAFEVQLNTNEPSEDGAVPWLTTRGGHAIINATLSYVRARSVSSDMRFSAWTEWLTVDPSLLPIVDPTYPVYLSIYGGSEYCFLDGGKVLVSP